MASGSPEHHVDWLGHRLDNRSNNSVVAAKERIKALISRVGVSSQIRPRIIQSYEGQGWVFAAAQISGSAVV
jgi:hypothetical protein